MVTISVAEAQATLQRASEQAMLKGVEIGAQLAEEQAALEVAQAAQEVAEQRAQMCELEDELQWQRDAREEEREAARQAKREAAQEGEQELAVMQSVFNAELQDMESLIGQVTAASVATERALQDRVSTLQCQLGGGTWLSAVGSAKQSAADALRGAAKAEAIFKIV